MLSFSSPYSIGVILDQLYIFEESLVLDFVFLYLSCLCLSGFDLNGF
jgi:hypothetical protein